MPKILTHSYSELLSITTHWNVNVKLNVIFLFPTVTFSRSFLFFSSFLSLSPLSLSSSLFLVAFVSLYFTVWASTIRGDRRGSGLWVYDLVVILEGCFSFSFFGCGFGFVIWLWFWWLVVVIVAVVVVVVVVVGGFILFFVFDGGGSLSI